MVTGMSGMRAGTALLLVGLLSIFGCRSGPRMDVPTVAASQTLRVATLLTDQASVALGRVVVGVRRGTTIAHFPRKSISVGRRLCNYRHERAETLEWDGGSREFGNWESEFGEIFFDVLSKRGFNVVGDARDLFKQADQAHSAEYLLGGRIVDIRGNLCEWFDGWDGRGLDLYSGEFYITVEWSVFSTLGDRTVARFRTSARYEQNDPKKEGINLAFSGAFARAAGNLANVQEFRRLLEKRPLVPQDAGGAIPENVAATAAPFIMPRIPLSRQSIERTSGQVLLSAVATIRIGGGHGSGFLIGHAGYLLTNQHVVGSAEKVQVVFANGLEVTGRVLRRDAANDVALVQIPIRARNILPIRDGMVRRLEEVYAVGSPMDEALQATVTKGVVSALRIDTSTGIRRIQADVPISAGNSGGPLLDKFGNVVGIAAWHVVHERAQNLNFFIPI
jgi:serine protease Do